LEFKTGQRVITIGETGYYKKGATGVVVELSFPIETPVIRIRFIEGDVLDGPGSVWWVYKHDVKQHIAHLFEEDV